MTCFPKQQLSLICALLVINGVADFSIASTLFAADEEPRSGTLESVEPEAVETVEADVVPFAKEQYGIVRAGYRFVTPVDNARAAAPYLRLKGGLMGGIAAGSIAPDLKVSGAATVINEDDYHAELLLDGGGAYRFNLESQALWHNLLTEQLSPTGTVVTQDLNPGQEYGLRVSTHQMEGRVRLGNNPFHLSLGYWELHREGVQQSRFSDHYFNDPASSVRSVANQVDQVTREGTIGLDGMFGPLGVAYTFRIRDFIDQSGPYRNTFNSSAGGTLLPGNQVYAATPDNRVISHTVKLYSDMSGGVQGAAAYTLLQRENNGGTGDAHPSSAPQDTVQAVSGDIRYTPLKELSFALKYRHQQIDRQSPDTISYSFASIPASGTIPGTMTTTPGVLLVRPSSDYREDSIAASLTYQPRSSTQLRLEYRAQREARLGLPDSQHPDAPQARYDDERLTHTGKITASWKPVNGTKLKAIYSYASCDNPAYTASFSQQHAAQLFATITPGHRWGVTASYLGKYENVEHQGRVTTTSSVLTLPRETVASSANTSIWFAPLSRLTVTTSYSFLDNATHQSLLFSNLSADSRVAADYRSFAHVYGIDAVYAVSEQIDFGVSLQQVHSTSRFSVPLAQFTDANNQFYSTAGITELTASRASETGLATRLDWRITPRYGVVLEYNLRRYSLGSDSGDGSLHTVMTLLSGHW